MAMKYIKPETKTFKVELQQMIADSPANQNLDKTETPVDDSNQIGARGFSFFDESEEE